MNKRSIKGQAALEFLTTYGWAFLVILIMIGTLAYFGILSPGKMLPNRCNFGTEFQCLDYQIDDTNNEFRLRMKNAVGEAIDVTSMTVTTESTTALTCTPPANPTSWKSGDINDLVWSSCTAFGGLIAGEKGKVLITIQFNTVASGSAYTKETQGEVFSTVV
ncbi:hypothetical protein CMO83_00175 [Candidatus Woesearchaeota archaeon]|nr:hypothetical protein [Candidatus Woesearchaeota archaeon]|tara:strand:- start:12638 stop:13123 length:486 start_codon:yes stop_codon:yes gene_type:complete